MKITLEDIEAQIDSEFYFTAKQGVMKAAMEDSSCSAGTPEQQEHLSRMTFCVITLKNGYVIEGLSACADPANFNAELGRKYAREQAINSAWPLLAYELRTKITNMDR